LEGTSDFPAPELVMTKSTHRHLAVFDAHLAPLVTKSARGGLSSNGLSGLSASGAASGAPAVSGSAGNGSAGSTGASSVVDGSDAELGEGELLQVGDLAKLSGKTVRAIHLYEDLGLLRPIDRSKGRFRLFNEESLQRVRWITKLQTLGLSLTEISELVKELEQSPSARAAADKLREVYLDKLVEVQKKLTEIHRLERELIASLTYLETCQSACASALPVHSCPSCERHPDQPTPPELVTGVHAH
jgi:DNA-binding transcriptional MerR regulator